MPGDPPPPPHQQLDRRCLRLRGLPFTVTEEQIVQLLSPAAALERLVICRRNGKCTGHAFAVCATEAQAEHAFSTLNKAYLGHRYVEIFHALPSEVDAAASGQSDYDSGRRRGSGGTAASVSSDRDGSAGPPAPVGAPAAEPAGLHAVARVSGVPAGVRPAELIAWLHPARTFGGSKGVHYQLDESGYFTGESLVVLEAGSDLQLALAKSGTPLKGAPVAVHESSRAALAEFLAPLLPRPPPRAAAAAPSEAAAATPVSAGGVRTPPLARISASSSASGASASGSLRAESWTYGAALRRGSGGAAVRGVHRRGSDSGVEARSAAATARPGAAAASMALAAGMAGLGIGHTPTGAFTQPTQPVPPLHPVPRRLLPATQAYAFAPTQQAYVGPQMLQLQPQLHIQLQMQVQPPSPPQQQACPYPQLWQQAAPLAARTSAPVFASAAHADLSGPAGPYVALMPQQPAPLQIEPAPPSLLLQPTPQLALPHVQAPQPHPCQRPYTAQHPPPRQG